MYNVYNVYNIYNIYIIYNLHVLSHYFGHSLPIISMLIAEFRACFPRRNLLGSILHACYCNVTKQARFCFLELFPHMVLPMAVILF